MPGRRPRRHLWLALALLAGAVAARASAQASRELEPQPGETCLACGAAIGDGGVVHVHRGRRVPLHSGPCEERWEKDPEGLFAKLQPQGLFHETSSTGTLRSPWFWFGVYVVAGLVCSAAAAYLAVNRAQPPLAWFFAGLVGNVAALAVLVFVIPRGDASTLPAGIPRGLAKIPTTRAPRTCDSCGASVHPSARSCRCGATLEPLSASEVPGAD